MWWVRGPFLQPPSPAVLHRARIRGFARRANRLTIAGRRPLRKWMPPGTDALTSLAERLNTASILGRWHVGHMRRQQRPAEHLHVRLIPLKKGQSLGRSLMLSSVSREVWRTQQTMMTILPICPRILTFILARVARRHRPARALASGRQLAGQSPPGRCRAATPLCRKTAVMAPGLQRLLVGVVISGCP